MPSPIPRKRHKWKPAFLLALAQTGVVTQAAQIAQVNPTTVFRARDPRGRTGPNLAEAQRFSRAWDAALQTAADRVETEIRRRALDGFDREYDVFYKGEKVGTRHVHAYSDRLLMFLAKALRPERFGAHPDLIPPPPTESEKLNILEETDRIAQERWNRALPMLLGIMTKDQAEEQADQALASAQPVSDPNAGQNPSANPSAPDPHPQNAAYFND